MLSKPKFIQVLKNINHVQIYQQRQWDSMYKNKTCKYWNALLFYNFIEDDSFYGISINLKEFTLYFNTLPSEKIKSLFDLMKNSSNDTIFLNDFEDFLNHLSSIEYNNLMNCLEKDDNMVDIDIDSISEKSNNNAIVCHDNQCASNNEGNLFIMIWNEIESFFKHVFSECIV